MQDFGREIYSHFPSEILHNLQYFPIFALFCGHISGVWQNNKGGVRRVETGERRRNKWETEEWRRNKK